MALVRHRRQAAGLGMAATLAPVVAPMLRQGVSDLYQYATSRSARPSVQRIITNSHEPKNADLASSVGLSGTSTPVRILLNSVDQGITGTNRTGRQIQMASLRCHLLFITDPSSLTDDVVRILVFADKECRGLAPSVGEYLQSVGTVSAQAVSAYDFDNVPTRFTVLADRVVHLKATASPTTTTTTQTIQEVMVDLKLNRRVHYYNTTGGGIVDIDSGAVWLVVIGVQNVHPSTMFYDTRIVFRDL